MKCKFKILVFQNGELDEEVETKVHEFPDAITLGNEMAKFAAVNSAVRFHQAIREIEMPKIQEPFISQGLGPETYLIIKEVIPCQ